MKVLLLVGPSGSGKDTLLRSAKNHFGQNGRLGFVRRYITRPPDDNEDNFYVDAKGFLILKKSDFFISTWQAHQNHYGISRHAINGNSGHQSLLCSISRDAISDFETTFAHTTTIHVTASMDALRQRLRMRGREQASEIEKRLERAAKPVRAKDLITFDNSSDLQRSITNFIALLENLEQHQERFT